MLLLLCTTEHYVCKVPRMLNEPTSRVSEIPDLNALQLKKGDL